MSRRAALLVAGLMMASTLGGCASGGWFSDPADSVVLAGPHPGAIAEQQLQQERTVHPDRVAAVPSAGAGIGYPSRQEGWIVEDHSPRQKAYTLDTGDRLRVFVYGQPNLSRLYNVDQSGSISVPLIGNIRARGLTTAGLEGAIRSRLSQGLVRDPQVTVDVQQNRPFFILGEVRTPGAYPYVTGMTVEMAVAIAGGFGERANERKARLSRRVGSYNEVIDVPTDTELEPGDTVYVYERFF